MTRSTNPINIRTASDEEGQCFEMTQSEFRSSQSTHHNLINLEHFAKKSGMELANQDAKLVDPKKVSMLYYITQQLQAVQPGY